MVCVVATTHQNSTCSMLTSAKLTEGYLVVGITRELNKGPLLHCSSIYINTRWSMLQQCVYLMSYYSSTMLLPHVSLLKLPCRIYVSWCHTLNLHCTCVHHVYTIRNSCPLTSFLTLTPSRLFLILLDSKSFQAVLASVIWLPGHMLSILSIYVWLTLALAKVCPHSHFITMGHNGSPCLQKELCMEYQYPNLFMQLPNTKDY